MTSTTPALPAGGLATGRALPAGRTVALGAMCLAGALLAGAARADGRAAAGPALPSATTIRIALRPEVQVARPEVALGDVAVLDTRDLGTLQRLAALPLGAAPRAGRAARIDRAILMRWMRARAGINPAHVAWTGEDACEVHLAVRDLSGETIARRAAESLRAQLSREGVRVEVGVREPPRDVAVPAGRVELDVRPAPRTAVIPRRTSAWVDVSVDGRFVRTVPVNLDVAVFGPAWIATREQAPGQLLDRSGLALREVEWSGLDALPVQTDVPAPLRLRRRLATGETLTRDQVEPAPLVARGGFATLRASEGLVRVESRVEVLQDGRTGETVRVRRPNATEAILARVTGPGVLEAVP